MSVIELDVTAVGAMRRQVGRAAASLRFAGLVCSAALLFAISIRTTADVTFLGGVVVAILIIWSTVRTGRRLRAGHPGAVALAAAWWFMTAAVLLCLLQPVLAGGVGWSGPYQLLVALVCVVLFVIARGLFSWWSFAYRSATPASSCSVTSSPWELLPGGRAVAPPAFVNKRSPGMYLILLVLAPLLPLPLILVGIYFSSSYPQGTVAAFAGFQLGSLIAVGPLMYGVLALVAQIYRRARRSALVPASELGRVGARPAVLYLRSFADDALRMWARTANGRSVLERCIRVGFEQVVTDHLWRYGPVVAIGQPGERIPPLGAFREYVGDGDWKPTVEELMRSSSLIVLVVGRTEGLAWELARIIDLGLLHKLVILFPPFQRGTLNLVNGEIPRRWHFLWQEALHAGLDLPRDLALYQTKAVVFPRGDPQIITALGSDDWNYEAVLDAAFLPVSPAGVPAAEDAQPRRSAGWLRLETLISVAMVVVWAVIVLPLVAMILT